MSALAYPATLPYPQAAPIQSDERRLLSDPPFESRPKQRDRLATQSITFPPMTKAEAAIFDAWWRNDLKLGGAWFSAVWPSPLGAVTGVYRFIGTPQKEFIPGGFWRISATLKVRGRGMLPQVNPLGFVYWLLPGSENFDDYGVLGKGEADHAGESISSTHQLFGRDTIYCGGLPGQRAQVASSPIPGPFCIEGDFYSDLVSGQGAIFSSRDSSARGFIAYANTFNLLQFSIDSGHNVIANPTGTFVPGAFNHFALNRDEAGQVQLFMGLSNGGAMTQRGPTVVAGLNKPLDTGDFWCCGADSTELGSINRFVGAIANLRVTLASLHTEPFIAPTGPFPH